MNINKDSSLQYLLASNRVGAHFAPFKSRSANKDGFDTKMSNWIKAVEEWAEKEKKLLITLSEIHSSFEMLDNKLHPDKECIRLVLSEMKRRSMIITGDNIKPPKSDESLLDNLLDPNRWLSWTFKKIVIQPVCWVFSSSFSETKPYSDSIDSTISDETEFVCMKVFELMASELKNELFNIVTKEKRSCFDLTELIEMIAPTMKTTLNMTDELQITRYTEHLINYLHHDGHVHLTQNSNGKYIKILSIQDKDQQMTGVISKKDIAEAQLRRVKELLTKEADRIYSEAEQAKKQAVEFFKCKNLVKAKSLLRTSKKLIAVAEVREKHLNNIESLIEQLEDTESNMSIICAYKDTAEALKIINSNYTDVSAIMDDVSESIAETNYLNQTMNEMISNMTNIPHLEELTTDDLEKELLSYGLEKDVIPKDKETSPIEKNYSVDNIIQKLDEIVIGNLPSGLIQSTPRKDQRLLKESL